FSGDKSQLVPMIKAAMSHPGFAFLDVISPCVTFNNNVGSTKSYSHVRDHIASTSMFDFVPQEESIEVDYAEGTDRTVELFDGSQIHLSKLAPDWDPTDRFTAVNRLHAAKSKGDILTGLLYINPESEDLHTKMKTTDTPLNTLGQEVLCPGSDRLEGINAEFR
ncbi:MAG: 2-oxoacid:ferredoxin oxidoreductase subunit beta, partial [Saprospiraceae bacterium]|nr:2-oxoacid:ferredoxin oxidoreductase subunit beta [Saprospiraceae bacterium]